MIKEWEKEPDEENFVYKGYDCRIRRIKDKLHLCGYVRINNEDMEKVNTDELIIHGGITFSKYANNVPLYEFPFSGYWIGFDCMHAGDLIPRDMDMIDCSNEVYRNFEYVRNELKKLVNQLILIKKTRKFVFEAYVGENPTKENERIKSALDKAFGYSCGHKLVINKNSYHPYYEHTSKWKVTMEEILE